MEDIIPYILQEVCVELMENWADILAEHGLGDLDLLASLLFDANNAKARELLTRLLSAIDTALLNNRELRKEQGLMVKQLARERRFMTKLGWIDYKRAYYYDKKNSKHTYPVDIMVGVPKHERISAEVSAALVNSAAEVSMRKSSKNVTGGDISAQTVCNKVHSVGVLENELPTTQRKIDELHIFADEDHASLQSGKNRDVPLVTMCEGVEKVGKNRNATVNPVHFTSDIAKTDTLWSRVYAYADKAYDLERVNKICIHGDGASWIKKGADEFSNATFYLDGYHLHKRLQPFLSSETTGCVSELIRTGRKHDFETFAKAIIAERRDAATRQTMTDNLKYIMNQWDGVVNRYSEGAVGSCTEAMVSHVLSERLSRSPMGWSVEGLNAMASIRVYLKNDGVVSREHMRRSECEREESKLDSYSQEMMESFKDLKIDQSIFEHRPLNRAKLSPINIIIKSLSRITVSPDQGKN